jgi:hypothetical protein
MFLYEGRTKGRRVWVYPTEERMLANYAHLFENGYKEMGIDFAALSREQYIILKGGLKRAFLFDERCGSDPLFLEFEGKKLGESEAGVAELKKAIKRKNEPEFYVPVRIFASAKA